MASTRKTASHAAGLLEKLTAEMNFIGSMYGICCRNCGKTASEMKAAGSKFDICGLCLRCHLLLLSKML